MSKTDTKPAAAPAPNTVTLDQPITREGQTITAFTLRKPAAGSMRGLSLVSVLNMEVDTLSTLIPRISEPMIHKPEVLAMDPADVLAAGIVVAGFLAQKADRDSLNA
jgi:hypothetical protein